MILRGLALERDSHATDVVERVTAVQAEEMAVIAFAEPVTELRHYHPVFDFLVLVLIQRPRVVGTREVEGRAIAQPKFQPQVGRGPPQKHLNGHYCDTLRFDSARSPTNRKKNTEDQFFHIFLILVISFGPENRHVNSQTNTSLRKRSGSV